MIRAVFFDIGETLVDESRSWLGWADWLGVPALTFCSVLGALIQRGEHHRQVFDYFAPGVDPKDLWARREREGWRYGFEPADFYPDALPTLAALKAQGLVVGLAGNQPEEAEAALRKSGVAADHIASSAGWGVEKPSPDFFARILDVTGLPADQIAYVGDRLDNDVIPALEAGMFAVFLMRGPWGVIQSEWPEAARAHAKIRALTDLPGVLGL